VPIRIDDPTLRHAAEQSFLCYFPDHTPVYVVGRDAPGAPFIYCRCGTRSFTVTVDHNDRRGVGQARLSLREPDADRARRQALGIAFYRAATDLTGEVYAWGALTGIRPARVIDRLVKGGMTDRQAEAYMKKRYGVEPRRARLASECAAAARAVEEALSPEDVGLYVGIPFCPSKCAYCSFVSQSTEKSGKLIPAYLEALETELDALAGSMAEQGKRVCALYVGGGTPTVLSAGQLDKLLAGLHRRWGLCRGGRWPSAAPIEFTVEAGRPDTIDGDKLAVMKSHGVNRASVNPQSMDDAVLQAIGRRHTAADTLRAVELAKRAGFETLNMDLIAGLPGDTPDGLLCSLRDVLTLKPENITLHTLAKKRGAVICRGDLWSPAGELSSPLQTAIDACHDLLRAAGYAPYYLYRQKFMAAGCENTGWRLPGHESVYNIVMMEELRGVMAAGAGGVSKLCHPSGRIERIFNPKYPTEYLRDIKVVADRKRNM